MKSNSEEVRGLFLHMLSNSMVTMQKIKEIIHINYSEDGSNDKRKEEDTMYAFELFLQDCSGIKNGVHVYLWNICTIHGCHKNNLYTEFSFQASSNTHPHSLQEKRIHLDISSPVYHIVNFKIHQTVMNWKNVSFQFRCLSHIGKQDIFILSSSNKSSAICLKCVTQIT